MRIASAPLRPALAVLVGPTIWAAHFLIVYAAESLLCRLVDAQAHTILVVVASVVAAALVLLHIWSLRGRSEGASEVAALAWLALALDWLSLLAIVFAGIGGLVLPACA